MFSNARRQQVEHILVTAYLTEAVKQGWRITGVDDEEALSGVAHKTSIRAAHDAVFAVDEAHVYVKSDTESGWFYFVLGNEGWTVLSDYTVNLDSVVDALDHIIDQYEAEDAR